MRVTLHFVPVTSHRRLGSCGKKKPRKPGLFRLQIKAKSFEKLSYLQAAGRCLLAIAPLRQTHSTLPAFVTPDMTSAEPLMIA
jgi:hypothetical protein